MDVSVFKNRIRTEFRFSAHPYCLCCLCGGKWDRDGDAMWCSVSNHHWRQTSLVPRRSWRLDQSRVVAGWRSTSTTTLRRLQTSLQQGHQSQLVSLQQSFYTLLGHFSFCISLSLAETKDSNQTAHDNGSRDWTYHAHHFIFSFTLNFNFLFIPCGRLCWLYTRQLFTAR